MFIGHTEVGNNCVEAYVRFFNGKLRTWESWLPWAEFWYNTILHTSLCTPFKAVNDHAHQACFVEGSTLMKSLEENLKERDAFLTDLANLLLGTAPYDKHWAGYEREISFQV